MLARHGNNKREVILKVLRSAEALKYHHVIDATGKKHDILVPGKKCSCNNQSEWSYRFWSLLDGRQRIWWVGTEGNGSGARKSTTATRTVRLGLNWGMNKHDLSWICWNKMCRGNLLAQEIKVNNSCPQPLPCEDLYLKASTRWTADIQ